MAKVLIIEDDTSILLPLEDNLKLEGYETASATDGDQGLAIAREGHYDLIILDIMLPKLNGLEICKQLRQGKNLTPILMLTAKSQEIDKVVGLELGADDYVTKPFSPRELLARIKAILRRTRQIQEGIDFYRFGNVEVDFKKYEAKKDSVPLDLTALEFAMLHLLIANHGEVVHRDRILNEVWGEDVYIEPRTIDKHISLLRKKVEDDPKDPRFIVGVRSIGYKFVE
jgi:two-component system alkaline phosphatase synthesis response regulator PhoP